MKNISLTWHIKLSLTLIGILFAFVLILSIINFEIMIPSVISLIIGGIAWVIHVVYLVFTDKQGISRRKSISSPLLDFFGLSLERSSFNQRCKYYFINALLIALILEFSDIIFGVQFNLLSTVLTIIFYTSFSFSHFYFVGEL